MEIRQDRLYTKEHEWVQCEGEIAFVGITAHAQEEMGDIVFVELPLEGTALGEGDPCAVVESVKAASNVYSPVGGSVANVNRSLEEHPELLNDAPWDQFIVGIAMAEGTLPAGLMTPEAYEVYVRENG